MNSFNHFTNGELLTFCEKHKLKLSSNPSRDQMISAIRQKFPNNFSSSSLQTQKNQMKTMLNKTPSSTKITARTTSQKLNTPRINFGSPSNQPTPILANQNADYERMWERKLGKQSEKIQKISYDKVPTSPYGSRQASPMLSPPREPEKESNSLTQLKVIGTLCLFIIILVVVS